MLNSEAKQLSRRELIHSAALAGGLAALGGVFTEGEARASRSPNAKLNIACIGCGGQGASDLGNVSSENIVALCDVDEARAAGAFKQYPDARKYQDFRKMLDEMGKDIDAVTVSIPDHQHAFAAALALKMGKHVYCQKPLTHSVSEARYLTNLAAKSRVATQMGTQGHSFPQYARLVELIQSGAIGKVREVHIVTDRAAGWWPQGMTESPPSAPVPATLNWDLWLGSASERPYNPAYLPFVWRGWWDFGTGALGDMACHLMDPAFWALKLKFPTSVEARPTEPPTRFSPPNSSIIVWEFPKRGDLPPVRLTWYDGKNKIPADLMEGAKPLVNGSLFVGDGGKIAVEHSKDPILLPESRFAGYKGPEPFIPRSPGHHREWIDAAKSGSATGSNFGYAGPMTETILLGNVALRVGRKIAYDSRRMSCPGCPEADVLIRPAYRTGWSL